MSALPILCFRVVGDGYDKQSEVFDMRVMVRRVLLELMILVVGATSGLSARSAVPPVADAARYADWELVDSLIQSGVDVTVPKIDGSTALHWASYWDKSDVVDLLIRTGADVNAVTDLGVTPLWTACENGSAEVVRKLLEAGADANAALSSGETVLMTASRVGAEDVVSLLLGFGANVDAVGVRNQTALMWAVAQRHVEVVQVLVSSGANIHARSRTRTEVVKTSPEPWNPEYVVDLEQGGYTPLLFAARVGDLDSAKVLVDAGADANDVAPYGTSATVVAAHSGHGSVARFLLENGADPDQMQAGYSALHAAILHKDVTLVRALLDHGADPNANVRASTPVRRDAVDFYLHPSYGGATPFWLAARFSAPEIMELLIAAGADARRSHFPIYWPGSLSVRGNRELVEEGETTALMAAVGMGGKDPLVSVDRLSRIAESAPVRSTRREPDSDVRELNVLASATIAIDNGVNLNASNSDGDTALHQAVRRGYDTVVKYLVGKGARVDVANRAGRTLLDLAEQTRSSDELLHDSTVDLLRVVGGGK